MFVTKPVKTEMIHDLGHLSTISYEGGNGPRTETMFITKYGDYIECHEADSYTKAFDLAADLRALTLPQMKLWIKERNWGGKVLG